MSVDLVLGTATSTTQPLNINDNGTLGTPISLPSATTTNAGLMSADDKSKIILQGGNTFGTDMVIGTKDNKSINFLTFNNVESRIMPNGYYYGPGISYYGGTNNSKVNTNVLGTIISRNIADGNAALTVNQANAGSTGNTLILQKAGNEQLSMSSSGVLKVNNLAGTGTRMVTADSFGALSAATEVSSGIYTPAATIAPTGTASADGFTYIRVGNIVTVTGLLTYTGATAGTSTIVIPMPIPSTFVNTTDLVGVVTGTDLNAASPNYVLADAVNNVAQVSFSSGSTSGRVMIQFQYQIL
ncbi:hypothetical protein F0919_07095 [Taibaiella lutea]|uniref:Uncharacterized protein n=1 Tax=Taibaiella lutea TaxID=2608001 RepID=A0A5M6CQK5_9BACT|nr:hypothetical protein [Taibaiella lutea]KAA5537434.1 hypothetical protein F0919_07095 [Taibaiella lutea]